MVGPDNPKTVAGPEKVSYRQSRVVSWGWGRVSLEKGPALRCSWACSFSLFLTGASLVAQEYSPRPQSGTLILVCLPLTQPVPLAGSSRWISGD